MHVYLAGPLFSQAERLWLRTLADALCAQGHQIFLPQEEASAPLFEQPPNPAGTFELCRQAIDTCEVILAVVDGPDTDSGTAWECGYAYARQKPVVALRTDFRGRGEDDGLNLMLRRSAAEVVYHRGDDFTQLIKALCEGLERARRLTIAD